MADGYRDGVRRLSLLRLARPGLPKSGLFGWAMLFSTSFAGTSLAADLPATLPLKAPPAVTMSDWNGFYLGAGFGFRSTQTSATVTRDIQNGVDSLGSCLTGFAAFGGCNTGEPLNDASSRFSGYVGYNYQVDRRWVVGVEGDVGSADKQTTLGGISYPFLTRTTGIAADSFSVKATWDASARARLGFLANPSLMIYATGGASWLHVESTSTCNAFINGNCSPAAGSGPLSITNSTARLGWTAGGGVEAMLAPNWIARGEYRYADYGTAGYTDRRALIGGTVDEFVSYDLRLKSHTATMGLAYKFGGPAAGPLSAYASMTLPAAAAVSWAGPYLGLGLGARLSLVDASMQAFMIGANNSLSGTCTTFANFGRCLTGQPLNGTAPRIAPYAGYNWQLAPQWVVAVEGDAGFGDKTTTLAGMSYPLTGIMSGRAIDTFSARTTWDASLRGRVGFLVQPSVLVYGTAGGALLHVESTSTCGIYNGALCAPAVSSGPLVITDARTKLGWTAGGGVEAQLWQNWLARAEYRYAEFGAASNTDVRTGSLGVVASYDLRLTTHTATFGLAYKFDGLTATR